MKSIDARGLSCPQPVVLLKKALAEQPNRCELIVDSATARENTARYAAESGYQVKVEEKDGAYFLQLQK